VHPVMHIGTLVGSVSQAMPHHAQVAVVRSSDDSLWRVSTRLISGIRVAVAFLHAQLVGPGKGIRLRPWVSPTLTPVYVPGPSCPLSGGRTRRRRTLRQIGRQQQ
jgi:hypothetical protein